MSRIPAPLILSLPKDAETRPSATLDLCLGLVADVLSLAALALLLACGGAFLAYWLC